MKYFQRYFKGKRIGMVDTDEINRFFAWYYFKVKNPDAYLKSMETRHMNKLINTPIIL